MPRHRRRRHEPAAASDPIRFLGQNIKGNPAMTAAQVAHDLRVIRPRADVIVVQEFEWPWYWRDLGRLLVSRVWHVFPHRLVGLARPVYGAQAVTWRRRRFKAGRRWVKLLHRGKAGISDDRWLRAVELTDRTTGLGFVAMTTHFVVGGDQADDGPERRAMMAGDLDHLDQLLNVLVTLGLPIVGELDANIHPGSPAYGRFRSIIEDHRGRAFLGVLGVEYTFVIDGRDELVDVTRVWEIPNAELNTDHEGRGITFTLRPRP